MNDNITISNACRFYNFALGNIDQRKSQHINWFIREHFTSLYESGQISELSIIKNFTTIIEHDEINVKNEDVIFSSELHFINQQTSVEDINRCLELIRFPHTSGDFLVNVIRNHPLMKDPPRDRYVSEALLYHVNNTSTPEVKLPRYWGRGIYYIGKDHSMYQCVSEAGNIECVKMMNLPAWVDNGSAVASHRERVVIVGGRNNERGDKRALLLDMTDNTKVTQLPDLPEPRYNTGVVLSDNDVYVVRGYNNKSRCVSSVYYLSLGSDAWQTKKSMPHKVDSPLVIQHQQCIYVLGRINYGQQSTVSQYNIKDETWKQCRNMPVACGSYVAGVVVHEGRIKVITEDKCLMYADDTDTWTVKQYNTLGDTVKAFVKRGQIWAVVKKNYTYDDTYRTYSMMSYDDVDSVWKTEHGRIDNVLLFC